MYKAIHNLQCYIRNAKWLYCISPSCILLFLSNKVINFLFHKGLFEILHFYSTSNGHPLSPPSLSFKARGVIFYIQTPHISDWLGSKIFDPSQVGSAIFGFSFRFGKFPLKIPNFSIFSLRVGSKSTRVKDESHSYFLRIRAHLYLILMPKSYCDDFFLGSEILLKNCQNFVNDSQFLSSFLNTSHNNKVRELIFCMDTAWTNILLLIHILYSKIKDQASMRLFPGPQAEKNEKGFLT